jgi:glycosyltransferase involved in cell wall biosynthesis
MWLEANKLVDGKLKNPKTKAYLPFWNLFDGSLSVSEATMKINDQKLKKYGYIRDSGVLTNIIDAKQILDQSRMDVEYQALNISQLGNPDAVMTNSSELTSAVFGEIDHAKQANSISLEPVTQPAKIFITNSRLSPEKNLDNLILAFIQLHNKYPEVELHIYGSDVGNYAPVLYNLVLENAATEYIKFFGYAPNSFPAIQTADVFLLPSHTEGQSIALMEAMVLKKNIIASNVLANIELLGNGEYGLLTEGNDPAALLKALTVMAEGRYKRLSDFDVNAHNRKVEEQFAMLFE